MKRFVIVDRRVSDGYHSYIMYLIDTYSKLVIDEERYGDLGFWGYTNETKTYDEALRELLFRNSLSQDDIEIIYDDIPNDILSIIYAFKDDEVDELEEIAREDDDELEYDELEECLTECFDVCDDSDCYEDCETGCI